MNNIYTADRLNYDFSSFVDIFNNIKKSESVKPSDLLGLKNELNRFFNDSKCKEVLYTNNIDKMFFGVKVIPIIDANNIYDYIIDDEPMRIDSYVVEIDSHMFDPIMDLSSREIVSVILHEVSHLVGDSHPVDDARNALNSYLAENKIHIKISDIIHYKEILAYGLKDYLSKSESMFYCSDISEINADEFMTAYNFNDQLINAYKKISNNNIKIYENSAVSKFVTFGWVLGLYNNIRTQRISAIRTLTRAKDLTGSRLEKMEMDNVIRRINRIDDEYLLESNPVDSVKSKIREKMRKARINNLRTIDSTFYELSMQVRNVEDENDALYLMRQINTSIAIIDEYKNSKDCDEYELNKWNQAMDKFIDLRDKLTSTVVYKNKNYGLFINYPDIVENRY